MKTTNPIYQVFRKEAQEMLRDRRVRSAAVIMPMAVILLIMMIFGIIATTVGGKSKQTVHIVRTNDPLVAQLKKSQKIKFIEIPDKEAGIKLIKEGKAKLVMTAQLSGKKEILTFLFDPKEDSGQVGKATVVGELGPILKEEARKALAAFNLKPEDAEPIKLVDEPIKVGEGPGASGMIASLLPYMLVLFTFTGGFAIAGDLVAGEKERNTLETLLICPASRTEIVIGKFLALCLVCLLSGLSAMIGLAIAPVLHLPGSETLFQSGLGVTPKAMGAIVLVMLPLVALFASVLLAVSSYARNSREAQTYMSYVNLIVIMPAILSQIIGLTGWGSQLWINAVPILGTANNIRSAILGKSAALPMLITIGVSAILAAIAISAAVRLFNREEVLVRT